MLNGLTAAEALRATKHPCCRQTLYRHVRIMRQLHQLKPNGDAPNAVKSSNVLNEKPSVPSCVETTFSESVSSPLTMPDCFADEETPYHLL